MRKVALNRMSRMSSNRILDVFGTFALNFIHLISSHTFIGLLFRKFLKESCIFIDIIACIHRWDDEVGLSIFIIDDEVIKIKFGFNFRQSQ